MVTDSEDGSDDDDDAMKNLSDLESSTSDGDDESDDDENKDGGKSEPKSNKQESLQKVITSLCDFEFRFEKNYAVKFQTNIRKFEVHNSVAQKSFFLILLLYEK